ACDPLAKRKSSASAPSRTMMSSFRRRLDSKAIRVSSSSSGLSSTRSTIFFEAIGSDKVFSTARNIEPSKGEVKSCTLVGCRLGPHPAAMPCQHPLNGGEAYPGAFELGDRVKPLK